MGSRRLEAQRANVTLFEVEHLREGCFRCDSCEKYFVGKVPLVQVASAIDRACYLFERYCDIGIDWKETQTNVRTGREAHYPYRPFREPLIDPHFDKVFKFWEVNFVQHTNWVGSLHIEAEELSNRCLESPLNTSLYCLLMVVKTLKSLADEFDLDICPELNRAYLLTSKLSDEQIKVTRQAKDKIVREHETTGQLLVCECLESGIPRQTDFEFDHRLQP
jgi:hypothetical protein